MHTMRFLTISSLQILHCGILWMKTPKIEQDTFEIDDKMTLAAQTIDNHSDICRHVLNRNGTLKALSNALTSLCFTA